jgi:hypothetical protein
MGEIKKDVEGRKLSHYEARHSTAFAWRRKQNLQHETSKSTEGLNKRRKPG